MEDTTIMENQDGSSVCLPVLIHRQIVRWALFFAQAHPRQIIRLQYKSAIAWLIQLSEYVDITY